MDFRACLNPVGNRGSAPVPFLNDLVTFGRVASSSLFAPNAVPVDAYTVIKSSLGTFKGLDASGTMLFVWDSMLHRIAAMLELMRVHAGRESSWNWKEGVDITNKRSTEDPNAEETGIFQFHYGTVFFDGIAGQKDILLPLAKTWGVGSPSLFIPFMKDEQNAMRIFEWYVRCVRIRVDWAGPLIRHNNDSVFPYLSRDAMREFMRFIS